MKKLALVFLVILTGMIGSGYMALPFASKNLVISIDTSTIHLSRVQCRQGLLWALSYLGADFPADQIDRVVTADLSDQIILHPEHLGLKGSAQQSFLRLCDSVIASKQYLTNKAIPIGAFIAIFIGNVDHYYAITQVPQTLDEFKKLHQTQPKTFDIHQSRIDGGRRRIQLSRHAGETYFWAMTSHPQIKTHSTEAIDLLPNGQLRFMIYDANGRLARAPNEPKNQAGKPGKCMWCHEGRIQKEHQVIKVNEQLSKFVDTLNLQLENYRSTLSAQHLYEPHKAHTYMEILYISYLEPTLQQLSMEWQMSVSELKILLKNSKRHLHPEFSFGDSLFDRQAIQHLAPFSMKVPGDVREYSVDDSPYLWR